MKKIRVVHILPSLISGGAERMAVYIAKGLDRERFEVAVFSIWRRLGCDLENVLDESDVQVRYLGKGSGFDCRTYYRLHRALKEYQPDIVHTHLHVLRYALPSMLWRSGPMLLHTVNNMAEREVEPSARWIQRYAFHNGVLPVAVAKDVETSLERLYGIHGCPVIWNGVPTNLYAFPKTSRAQWRAREGFEDDEILFVCVARFAPQKNHALLLKAFSQGAASDPKARLVLVGDGALKEELQGQARRLGLARQVRFLGLRADIPDILGAMDVFALSSDWEGHPLCVMEAMASGLPIVSTAVGGVPELLDNGREGLIVQPGDVYGFTNGLKFLLRNRDARREFGLAAARRAKENFDVSVMIQAYEKLYENLLGRVNRRKRDVLEEFTMRTEEGLGVKVDAAT